MKRILREPLVHFIVIGVGLFILYGIMGGSSGPQSKRVVVTYGQIERLSTGFARTWQRPPTEEELAGLVNDHIREEIYYREALAMGLDRDDTIVRRRLRQKMEFISDDIADMAEPSDEQLREYLQKHPEAYRIEPRVAFRHVFINSDKRGATANLHARRLRPKLESMNPEVGIAAIGDALMVPDEFALTPASEISGIFGEKFTQQLMEVESGRWSEPIASGYGLHLVFVQDRTEGRLPDLDEVREAVERDWIAARRKEVNEAAYQELRERYTVVIEQPQELNAGEAMAAEVQR